MPKNILVTGGAGFIGSFIVDALVKRGHRVRIFDNLDPQVHPQGLMPDYVNPEAEFIPGDVRDYDSLKRSIVCSEQSESIGVEIIFHMAGAVGVGQSQYEIKKYIDVNTGGTANLLDILVNHPNKVAKLIVAASMSSYGEGYYQCPDCGRIRPGLRPETQLEKGDWNVYCPNCNNMAEPIPIDEEAKLNCNSIYALSKMDQENICILMGKTYKIPTVALRFFNVYGPRQSLSNPYTGVTAIFMSRIKNDKPPIIYEDGLQSRDFISIHDIVEANLMAMEKEEANYEVFNVGTGQPLIISEIAQKLAILYGKDIEPVITNKFRKGDVRHCYADITKIKERLHWEPKVSFEEGMKELIEWAYGAEAIDKLDHAIEELKEKRLM